MTHVFGGKRVVPDGRNDKHDEANGRSLQFVFFNKPKDSKRLILCVVYVCGICF